MGFFRSSGLFIVTTLFLVAVLSLNLFLVLSSSLEYTNLEENAVNVAQDIIYSQADINKSLNSTNKTYSDLKKYCVDYNMVGEEIIVNGYNVSMFCSSLPENPEQSLKETMNSAVRNFVHDIYYKQYECDFWGCLGENEFFVLISQKAYNYWHEKVSVSLIAAIILLVLMFLLVEKKQNFFLLSGGLIILSSLPFVKLAPLLSGFLGPDMYGFVVIFISQSSEVFLGSFILGVLLIVMGILWHFFNIGKYISNKISLAKSNKVSKQENKPDKGSTTTSQKK